MMRQEKDKIMKNNLNENETSFHSAAQYRIQSLLKNIIYLSLSSLGRKEGAQGRNEMNSSLSGNPNPANE